MSDKDLIQEAREWGGSYASWGDNGLVDRLADALEARQVDEAALAKVILKHRYMEYPAGLCSCGVDSVGLDRVHEDHMARAVVEFLGERHEPDSGKCGGCRDLGPHRNVPGCDYYEPEPVKCDYCGDELPSVKYRSHLPTTPNLQRRGFAADKIVCPECVERPAAQQPSENLVYEPRQDSMLLWEGASSASTYPAYEHGDAEEREAEYKDHAATVTSEPTDAQIEAGLKKVDWDAIRAGEADPEEAAGVAVRAALEAALVAAQGAAPQAESADCDRDGMGICKRCGMGLDAGKVLDGDFACPVLPTSAAGRVLAALGTEDE